MTKRKNPAGSGRASVVLLRRTTRAALPGFPRGNDDPAGDRDVLRHPGKSYEQNAEGQMRGRSIGDSDHAFHARVIAAGVPEFPLLVEGVLERVAAGEVVGLERVLFVGDDGVVLVVLVGPDHGFTGLDRELG